ncbi:Catabolite control protein A [Pseudobythopirellula maris]|uniref:Catabolite control protein A n=1 Tax=Pseudobythopirellula maris TaxID=2527991 RepID=A0A5C5ZGC9_9BACT|nr:LacI family DNA-binding transcriptional regulator [Pseudobythopirellula maris]TWT86198.1 Catabolite control protein A [Pseudobythopirellula maris]
MGSIREIAREAGVSIATVSRVLNGNNTVKPELRLRVLETAEAKGYAPTVGKRTAERIALLYTDQFFLGSPYDSACIVGLGRAMRRSPYDLALLDMTRDRGVGESLKQFFARKGVCGAVVRSAVEQRAELVTMAAEGAPLVVIGDHFECDDLRFVYADSRAASREALEHLVSLGHQRIGFVTCDREDGDHNDRLGAYREVLEAAGVYREEDIHRVPPFRMDGSPLVRRILSKSDRPTALFIADPLVAVGVINEAQRLGASVPGDLSVIGFDDWDTRNTVLPRMSAVCQDSALIGEAAFDAVRAQVEEKPTPSMTAKAQEAWFEIHDTTAPPPSKVKRFFPSSSSASYATRPD